MTNNYCFGLTARGYAHCMHTVQIHNTINPPQREEVCCHCGETRMMPAVITVTDPEHGKYLPLRKRD